MRKWTIVLTLLMAAIATAALALVTSAQAASAPAAPARVTTAVLTDTAPLTDTASMTGMAGMEGMTDTASLTETAEVTNLTVLTDESFLTLHLTAGFPLDPFIVSVNGGGPVDAATLDPSCVGHISQQPVLSLHWHGKADFARIFYFSDHDPSLVIMKPDGSVVCNAQAIPQIADPSIDVDAPAEGTYHIWVGNQDEDGLIPGILVLTTKKAFDAGTFQLQGLIKRPALAQAAGDVMDALPEGPQLESLLAGLLKAKSDLPTIADGVDLTATVAVTGEIPGFVWPTAEGSPLAVCSGLTAGVSRLSFAVGDDAPAFRILFDSTGDTSLIVFTPDGTALCQDESDNGANRNPVLDVENPAPGNYAVLVGRLVDTDTVTGTLTVTTDLSRTPSLLEPAAPAPTSN